MLQIWLPSASLLSYSLDICVCHPTGIVTSGDGVGNSDYVHPAVAALKELERTVALLRLENGKYIDFEAKLSGINCLLH